MYLHKHQCLRLMQQCHHWAMCHLLFTPRHSAVDNTLMYFAFKPLLGPARGSNLPIIDCHYLINLL